MKQFLAASLLAAGLASPAAAEEPIIHFSAGSLRAPLTELAASFTAATGIKVEQSYMASGMIKDRIEAGTRVGLFTSANMEHPLALSKSGKMGPVVLFARNELCAFVTPRAGVVGDDVLSRMLDPAVKLGTSTPKSDPAGDYAFELFARAEAVKPGARAALEAKALQLTGGPTSPPPPADRNVYASLLASGAADIMLAYCTNSRPIAKELPEARMVRFTGPLVVRADYGLAVAPDAPASAYRFALHLLSPEGQRVLETYGFSAPTKPADVVP